MTTLQTEQIFYPFTLNKSNVIDIRLGTGIDFIGENWHVGLKAFSLKKKWSLVGEKITIIWTNGYKSELTPKRKTLLTDVEEIVDELFSQKIKQKRHITQQTRKSKREKRDDIFDDITFNDDSSESEKEEEKKTEREVTPPPFIAPFDPEKLDSKNSDEKPKRPVTPPPFIAPFDFDSPPTPRVHENKKEMEEREKTAKEIGIIDSKNKIEEVVDKDKFVLNDSEIKIPGMKPVLFPVDEPGKTGYKKYLVYESLKDAHFYSPSLPINANPFTIEGYKSIKFEKDKEGYYFCTYNVEYVRAIHMTPSFYKALGFNNEIILRNPTKAERKVSLEPSFEHICLSLNVACPIYCGLERENLFAVVPLSEGNLPLNYIISEPSYVKLNLSHIDTMTIELKDLFGNPIYGDNTSGYVWLEFIKKKVKDEENRSFR